MVIKSNMDPNEVVMWEIRLARSHIMNAIVAVDDNTMRDNLEQLLLHTEKALEMQDNIWARTLIKEK